MQEGGWDILDWFAKKESTTHQMNGALDALSLPGDYSPNIVNTKYNIISIMIIPPPINNHHIHGSNPGFNIFHFPFLIPRFFCI